MPSHVRNPAPLGRIFREDEFRPGAPGAVILSNRLWRRRFAGDPRVIGRQVMMNGQSYTIVGVMPPDFFLYQRHELWTAWQMSGELAGTRDAHFPSIVRLRPGVTAQRAQAEAEAAFHAMAMADVHKGYGLRLESFSDQIMGPVRPALLVALATFRRKNDGLNSFDSVPPGAGCCKTEPKTGPKHF